MIGYLQIPVDLPLGKDPSTHWTENNRKIVPCRETNSCRSVRSLVKSFFPPEGGVGQIQAWMPTYVSILHIPQMI
jgi:hypothetical protein